MDINVLVLALVALVIVLLVAVVVLVTALSRHANETAGLVPPEVIHDLLVNFIEVLVPVAREGVLRVPGDMDDVALDALINYLKRRGLYVEPDPTTTTTTTTTQG
jgi:hypothetical protein